ncbi:MAG: hypothetical protein GX892_18045 [Thermoanaerobacteraceae bacterium]|nr:hypothetical protein [Thermoanaerobacteraceae bacterium]
MSSDKTRVNILVPNDVKEYYQKRAKHLGISMAASMNVALKQQMDQEQLIENIPGMLERIKELEAEIERK